jgi:hypothetical protein
VRAGKVGRIHRALAPDEDDLVRFVDLRPVGSRHRVRDGIVAAAASHCVGRLARLRSMIRDDTRRERPCSRGRGGTTSILSLYSIACRRRGFVSSVTIAGGQKGAQAGAVGAVENSEAMSSPILRIIRRARGSFTAGNDSAATKTPGLLHLERPNRIDRGCAAGRHSARHERREQHGSRGARERHAIMRRHTNEPCAQ